MSDTMADRQITLTLTRTDIATLLRLQAPFLIDQHHTQAVTKLLRALDEDERNRLRSG